MYRLRVAMLLTLLLTALVALGIFFLPPPASWHGGLLEFQLRLIVAILVPASHVIAALFFFLGLAGFKQELRTAWRRIAIGVIGLGFSLLAAPVVTFLDLWDKWPMQYGILSPPYIISVLIVLAGVRVFYRKLEFKSMWRSPWTNVGFIGVITLATIFMPHVPSKLPEVVYDFGNVMFALVSGFLLLTTCNVFAVRAYVAPSYARVLKWLGIGLGLVSLVVAPSIILKAIGIDPKDAAGNLQNLLILAVIPYLIAGYRFYLLTADTRGGARQANASAVDVIIYTASLASNTQAIDPILDGLRAVTAPLQPGQQLNPVDQAALGDVYLRLETYLVNEERLRSFSAADLRASIYNRFKEANPTIDQAFWSKLPLPNTPQL